MVPMSPMRLIAHTVDCGPGGDVVYVNVRSDRARSRNCEVIRDV